MLAIGKSIERICCLFALRCAVLSNFVAANHSVCEKWEKQPLQPFWVRPRIVSVRHSFWNSEALGLLSRVIVVDVEDRMLPQFSLSRNV
jgi:hypothetical protein